MVNLLVMLLTALALNVLPVVSDVTGSWELEATFDDGTEAGGFDCAFKQDGEQLTGTCSGGTAQVTGEVKGQNIRWQLRSARMPADNNLTFTGTLDDAGTSINGRFTVAGKGGDFSAVKSR